MIYNIINIDFKKVSIYIGAFFIYFSDSKYNYDKKTTDL
ncbi:hypothetical protein SAMN05421540_10116 [Psychroflexus halocasei]|uniref:Uncharacterized protein n=1 Tax=Psychroflexus halocasei TaxID=908615 RepID=A0A1H3VDB9_9FLAO|nr:hypothetical protein SAMN05421540_10116 [Psychroflexus halocasei]